MNGNANIIYQYSLLLAGSARYITMDDFTDFRKTFELVKILKVFDMSNIISKYFVKFQIAVLKPHCMDRYYRTPRLIHICFGKIFLCAGYAGKYHLTAPNQ